LKLTETYLILHSCYSYSAKLLPAKLLYNIITENIAILETFYRIDKVFAHVD